MALTKIKADALTADLIDGTKLADDSIDSEHYNDGSIDNAHIADDAIDSEHYAAGSIDHEHLADNAVDGDIIADNSVGLAHMAGGTDGKIITYDANGDPLAVGPGTVGQVLTSTGAGSPPAFEDAAAGGKILQVKTETYNTQVSGSTTFFDSGLSIDFAPTDSNSTLLVIVQQNGCEDRGSSGHCGLDCKLFKDSTQKIQTNRALSGYNELAAYFCMMHEELAGSTSQATWKTQVAGIHTTSYAQRNNSPSFITIMEISA